MFGLPPAEFPRPRQSMRSFSIPSTATIAPTGKNASSGKKERPKHHRWDQKIVQCIQTHPWNQSIQILVPGNQAKVDGIVPWKENPNGEEKEQWQWFECEQSLAWFFQSASMLSRIHDGTLMLLSKHAQIGTQDVVSIQDARLQLHLTRNTYETFGIPGRASKLSPGMFVVQVDLSAHVFQPGTKLFKRIVECCKRTLDAKQSFWLAILSGNDALPWEDPGVFQGEPKPRLLQPPTWHCEPREKILVPDVPEFLETNKQGPPNKYSTLAIQEWLEWCGLSPNSNLDSLGGDSVDPYISLYRVPEPNQLGKVTMWSCDACILPSSRIQSIWQQVQRYQHFLYTRHGCAALLHDTVARHFIFIFDRYFQEAEIPWLAMQVQGIPDAPESWTGKEHGSGLSGCHGYTVILHRSPSTLEGAAMLVQYVNGEDEFLRLPKLGLWGFAAGTAVVFFAERIPRIRKDVFSKIPILGQYSVWQEYVHYGE